MNQLPFIYSFSMKSNKVKQGWSCSRCTLFVDTTIEFSNQAFAATGICPVCYHPRPTRWKCEDCQFTNDHSKSKLKFESKIESKTESKYSMDEDKDDEFKFDHICGKCSHINLEIHPYKTMRHPVTFNWLCPNTDCNFENEPLNVICQFCKFDHIDIQPTLTADQLVIFEYLRNGHHDQTITQEPIETKLNEHKNEHEKVKREMNTKTKNLANIKKIDIKKIDKIEEVENKKETISSTAQSLDFKYSDEFGLTSIYIFDLVPFLEMKKSTKYLELCARIIMRQQDNQNQEKKLNYLKFQKFINDKIIPFSGGFAAFDGENENLNTISWICIQCCNILHKNRLKCYCGQIQTQSSNYKIKLGLKDLSIDKIDQIDRESKLEESPGQFWITRAQNHLEKFKLIPSFNDRSIEIDINDLDSPHIVNFLLDLKINFKGIFRAFHYI